jgi:hypothetical protein
LWQSSDDFVDQLLVERRNQQRRHANQHRDAEIQRAVEARIEHADRAQDGEAHEPERQRQHEAHHALDHDRRDHVRTVEAAFRHHHGADRIGADRRRQRETPHH